MSSSDPKEAKTAGVAAETPKFARPLLGMLVIVTVLIAGGGYWLYEYQESSLRSEKMAYLDAVAALKTSQIMTWRRDLLAYASLNASGGLGTLLQKWKTHPQDSQILGTLWERMKTVREIRNLQNIIVTSLDGDVLLTLDVHYEKAEPVTVALLHQSAASGKAVMGDFYRCRTCDQIHIEVAVPVFDDDKKIFAMLLFRADPRRFLYPMLERWSTPSTSAESLLLRREEGGVRFLNNLRYLSQPPLSLMLPDSRQDLPAVQAAEGRTGTFEGVDYHGAKVVSNLRAVPDSPWFMVTKIDEDELLYEAHMRGWLILALVLCAILLSGGGFALFFVIRQHHLAQTLLAAQEARRHINESLHAVFTASPDALLVFRRDGFMLEANEAAVDRYGYQSDEWSHVSIFDLNVSEMHDKIRLRFRDAFENQIRFETVHRSKNGEIFPVEVRSKPFFFAGQETVLSSVRDISERKNAEKEHAKLEEQFRQAQKMESVGRLAGGVAHDFNNLLTGMIGNISLSLQELREEDPLAESLRDVLKAAESAANLTRQLLTFSRRQIVEPKVVNLNEMVANLQRMLARLIGENISLSTQLAADLWPAKIDVGQFEQVLVNLVVNARDAMPEGGRLTIETQNLTLDEEYAAHHEQTIPGDYVMLAVADTGCGMPPEVIAQIFEPFFTTKARDKGTGLGLSMVYGSVKQAGGSIEVYSELGVGTIFKVYLPRVMEACRPVEAQRVINDMPCGNGRILLVEDENMVRALAEKVLKRLGYEVFAFSRAQEALDFAAKHPEPVALLMTDVVMPGMNGMQLAKNMVTLRPDIRVLFSSGYTQNVIVHHGVLEEGIHFLGKPYTPAALAEKVRAVLESPILPLDI